MTTATSLNELQQQIRDRYDSLSKAAAGVPLCAG